MKSMQGQKGFTLIEILLVVTIMGFMLAVILPRAFRTTTDAKYNLIRQQATELAGYANQWVEEQMLAQDTNSTATKSNYFRTLVEPDGDVPANSYAAWIADTSHSNWNEYGAKFGVRNRTVNGLPVGGGAPPEATVESMIEPAQIPRNPFNGVNIFLGTNMPRATQVVPGALACSTAQDSSIGGPYDYYALIFQGTDSTVGDPDPLAAGVDFHAGMRAAQLGGLRNGIMVAKVQP